MPALNDDLRIAHALDAVLAQQLGQGLDRARDDLHEHGDGVAVAVGHGQRQLCARLHIEADGRVVRRVDHEHIAVVHGGNQRSRGHEDSILDRVGLGAHAHSGAAAQLELRVGHMADEVDGAGAAAHLAVHGGDMAAVFVDLPVGQDDLKLINGAGLREGVEIGAEHLAEQLFARHGKVHADGVDGRHGAERRGIGQRNEVTDRNRRFGGQPREGSADGAAVEIDAGVGEGGLRLLHLRPGGGEGGFGFLLGLQGIGVVLLGDGAAGDQLAVAFRVLPGAVVGGAGLKHGGLCRRQRGGALVDGGLVGGGVDFKKHIALLHQTAVGVNTVQQLAADLGADIRLLHAAQVSEPGGDEVDILLLHVHDGNVEGGQVLLLSRRVGLLTAGKARSE